MTVAELERATARLGFLPSLEDGGDLLRDAANRALLEISAVRPRIATATVWHLPPIPLYQEGGTEVRHGARTLTLGGGRSFFLRILGSGTLRAARGSHTLTYAFTRTDSAHPAVLGGALPEGEGAVSLTLTAEGGYRLLSLAVYAESYDTLPPDPLNRCDYDLAILLPSFGGLSAPPRDERGRPIPEGESGYLLREGHILSLPPHSAGRITITYRRELKLPEAGEIPLPEEEASLLPLFCAAYVFLDEDATRAGFYLARFREGLSLLRHTEGSTARYADVTGWG